MINPHSRPAHERDPYLQRSPAPGTLGAPTMAMHGGSHKIVATTHRRATATNPATSYTVRHGDTTHDIAMRHSTTRAAILAFNPHLPKAESGDFARLRVGERLHIPASRQLRTMAGWADTPTQEQGGHGFRQQSGGTTRARRPQTQTHLMMKANAMAGPGVPYCSPGMHLNSSNTCVADPPTPKSPPTGGLIKTCPPGSSWSAARKQCLTPQGRPVAPAPKKTPGTRPEGPMPKCPPGSSWSSQSNQCVAGPGRCFTAGKVGQLDPATGKCVEPVDPRRDVRLRRRLPQGASRGILMGNGSLGDPCNYDDADFDPVACAQGYTGGGGSPDPSGGAPDPTGGATPECQSDGDCGWGQSCSGGECVYFAPDSGDATSSTGGGGSGTPGSGGGNADACTAAGGTYWQSPDGTSGGCTMPPGSSTTTPDGGGTGTTTPGGGGTGTTWKAGDKCGASAHILAADMQCHCDTGFDWASATGLDCKKVAAGGSTTPPPPKPTPPGPKPGPGTDGKTSLDAKTGMSPWAMAGIGLGIAAVLGGGVYYATRKPSGAKAPAKLPAHAKKKK